MANGSLKKCLKALDLMPIGLKENMIKDKKTFEWQRDKRTYKKWWIKHFFKFTYT